MENDIAVYLIFESISNQLYAFLEEVYEVTPQELLFDYVLCGSDTIYVDDWQRHTMYRDNLKDHDVQTWFWEIVREMPDEYRRHLLHFATTSFRPPMTGFRALTSQDGRLFPFALEGVAQGENIWSHACFNRLGLPLYYDS
uniref:HECT-type E3 ubiquitin transferase n=1 Tax=Globisporangium ultimum (strain ATCC 200006 / CBS 805.95 / DAOM BR144) TaxID=431595 RepID=K3X483_GLOUD